MSEEGSKTGPTGISAIDADDEGLPGRRPASRADRKVRKRRGPTPAELALLRWLAAKPRPVMVGPIGNCVKRGWCEPVRQVVEDYDGRWLGIVYVVTEAGSSLLWRHCPDGAVANPALRDVETPPATDEPRSDIPIRRE